jgi:[methyl-Co(III) methanol-specific corrinoid protein]:coenzyme M methyltransferase
MTSKERVLGLLDGKKIDRVPCFSGMGNITTEGMRQVGVDRFASVHQDAKIMADLAATTPKLFGYDCAVVPFDLCIEAEALGTKLNFYPHREDVVYPTIKSKVATVGEAFTVPDDLEERGRIPLVAEAISKIKDEIGDSVPIGSYVLGPFTLAGQVMDLNELLKMSFKKPDEINKIVEQLDEVLIRIAKVWEEAGADYITVREMGAPEDVISPRMFKSLVMPHLTKVIDNIGTKKVLHICGKTNMIVGMMGQCGADAVAVEQQNDVRKSREALGAEAIILGNIDAYRVLVEGEPETVRAAVKGAIEAGVNGVWPGCDIWPDVPPANMKAMVEATKEFGKLG